MSPAGRLVAFEGIDGAGKSTLLKAVAARLRARGYRVVRRREPHDRRLGRAALSLADRDPREAALLFSLDRLLARPALEATLRSGAIVLTDRSFFSTLAYQASRLRPAERDHLTALQSRLTLVPDRVVWLDVAPEMALRRIARRGTARAPPERMRELRRVRGAYRRLARGRGWLRLPADGPRKELLARTERFLAPALGPVPRRRVPRR